VTIDLTHWIRAGDCIWWNECTAEPLTLTETLVAQRETIGGCSVFVGPTYTSTLQPEHADWLSILSYCGIGENRKLLAAGAMQLIPSHCSQLHRLPLEGAAKADVVFLHLSPEGPDGRRSLGIANDYLIAAAKQARVVIAEVNQQMPWTFTSHALDGIKIDAIVHSDRPLIELKRSAISAIEGSIARYASAFIGDRSVLEMGVGAIPESILSALSDRKDLGIHTGMLGDVAVDLIESGAVTNGFKTLDRGLTTAGVLMGTRRLYEFARHNALLNIQPFSYVHTYATLAQLENFMAINSAIEVDLTGQVGAEVIDGKYIGATGGQVDFTRGALAAKGGRSIVALPSTAKGGQLSRIVVNLQGPATSLRADADVVVTEWGSAQLRGQTLQERVKRMIAIAHPEHRERLGREVHEQGVR
jgi:acyl-CoA hydrolase